MLVLVGLLGAVPIKETLEITADKFLANEKKRTTIIEGHVFIKKGQDTLTADKVVIYTNQKRKPIKYEAIGSVKFHIVTQDGRHVEGHSDRLIYDAIKREYRLLQNAVVNEVGKINSIKGEEIILNNVSGYADVVGGKDKPAKFIFDMEDIQKANEQEKAKKAQKAQHSKESHAPN
ncbi:hypothetical protein NHP200010_02710 [Helicobacter bizzozeronii]|nr:hypothetical protein NHP200010_02710 [Helicobacter bizzozeronii]GMT39150.1 hypothetical protein NHP20013_12710 [Helicobacter bizzozeronii]